MNHKKLENQFMLKLLAHAKKDLNQMYDRRGDFIAGRTINFCKITTANFSGSKNIKEFESAHKAFTLGFEFGINIAIDTFNGIMLGLNKPKSAKHKQLLSKSILKKLSKTNKK